MNHEFSHVSAPTYFSISCVIYESVIADRMLNVGFTFSDAGCLKSTIAKEKNGATAG